MYRVEIRRPNIKDKEELNQFFYEVVHDTFAREGLAELHDDINSETESKKRYLEADFGSHGENRYFWIAEDQSNQKIVGTIEYGPASDLIIKCTSGALEGWFEIGTVFVHPDYQGQGIGTLLLNIMLLTLRNQGIQEFCLDSGYAHAQKIWRKKLGNPDYCLKDYWGEGADHMIWKRRTNDMPLVFRNDLFQ